MIPIKKDAKIYIVSFPNFESGGPELLHQLCRSLTDLGFNAYMYYDGMPKKAADPTPEKFKKYGTRYVDKIEDSINNYLIFPEAIEITAKRNKKIRKIMWWLGVNHYLVYSEIWKRPLWTYAKHLGQAILNIRPSYFMYELKRSDFVFLGQCNYVISFLNNKGIKNVPLLSDYISLDFIESSEKSLAKRGKDRKNQVIYNPGRNIQYVKKLIKFAPDIEFVPLVGYKPEELKKVISDSKIYIDFGSHPGKDRLPRECAMLGCCIITSTRGSAGFYEDLPISSEYKFRRTGENIPKIVKKIRHIFENYDNEIINFDFYRDRIREEKKMFETQVENLFLEVN